MQPGLLIYFLHQYRQKDNIFENFYIVTIIIIIIIIIIVLLLFVLRLSREISGKYCDNFVATGCNTTSLNYHTVVNQRRDRYFNASLGFPDCRRRRD